MIYFQLDEHFHEYKYVFASVCFHYINTGKIHPTSLYITTIGDITDNIIKICVILVTNGMTVKFIIYIAVFSETLAL